MKLRSNNPEKASVLVLALLTCVVIGIVLSSFLALISARNKMTIRSTSWNTAIPVAEAGIEEALTHLEKDKNNPTANSWAQTTIAGQTVYTKTRTLPDGSYCNVTIYTPDKNPLIYSQGFVPSPLESGKYIARLIRVGATNPPYLFNLAVATSGKVKFTGGSIVDGYDSSKGLYNVLSNRNDVGGVATSSNDPQAVDVGGAHIYGKVVTGPTGGITLAPGGAIGDIAWNASHTGIEPGWTNNDMNVSFPANNPPGTGPYPVPGVTNYFGVTATLLLNGTNQMSSFSSTSANKPMLVAGKATLWVTGDFKVTGTGFIKILPGASLTLYLAGDGDIGGGGVVNDSGLAANFSIIGLPTCKSVKFSGGSDFYGTVNAPSADVSLNGGANLFGALIAANFTAVGTSGLHYDRTLAKDSILVVTSWKEL